MSKFNKTSDGKIISRGLDDEAPYSLGNATYYSECKCTKCGPLIDDEIWMDHGYYDGYNWEVPRCSKCNDFLPAVKVKPESIFYRGY
jgi:hypothetical protein